MRSWRPLAGILLLSIVFARPAIQAGQPPGQPPEEGFTLAVVRRDAIVVPIATYDGKRWKNSWPRPQSKVTAPIGLVDIPARWWSGREPAARWTFWPIRGASQEIKTIGPAWYPTYCSQGVGLRTTYVPPIPPPPVHVRPYPKEGLAVAGTAAIAPIEILDATTAPIARELEESLASDVFTKETAYLKVLERASWRHPYDEEERKGTPIRIEAVYRVPRGQGDRDVYYFEGFKHYAVRMPPQDSARRDRARAAQGPGVSASTASPTAAATATSTTPATTATSTPEQAAGKTVETATTERGQGTTAEKKKPFVLPACDLVTFVSGFFMRRADAKEKIDPLNLIVTPTSCDFENALILLPLGTVRVGDRTLWVVQWSGHHTEFYKVIDVEDDKVRQVADAGGGGCSNQE